MRPTATAASRARGPVCMLAGTASPQQARSIAAGRHTTTRQEALHALKPPAPTDVAQLSPASQSESHRQILAQTSATQVVCGGQLSVGGMLRQVMPSGEGAAKTHAPVSVSANRSTSHCMPSSATQPVFAIGSQTWILARSLSQPLAAAEADAPLALGLVVPCPPVGALDAPTSGARPPAAAAFGAEAEAALPVLLEAVPDGTETSVTSRVADASSPGPASKSTNMSPRPSPVA